MSRGSGSSSADRKNTLPTFALEMTWSKHFLSFFLLEVGNYVFGVNLGFHLWQQGYDWHVLAGCLSCCAYQPNIRHHYHAPSPYHIDDTQGCLWNRRVTGDDPSSPRIGPGIDATTVGAGAEDGNVADTKPVADWVMARLRAYTLRLDRHSGIIHLDGVCDDHRASTLALHSSVAYRGCRFWSDACE